MNERSTYLFAMPSFLSGMARVLDIGGELDAFNESLTPSEADAIALHNDWAAVGEDLLHACRHVHDDPRQLELFAEYHEGK